MSHLSQEEREKLQTELQDRNKQLKMALTNSKLGLWDWNIKTGESFYDDVYYSMLGYEENDFGPSVQNWKNLIHPDDVEEALQLLNAHIEGLTPYYEASYRLKKKTGGWIWILDRGRVIEWDEDGNALRAIGTHQDISKIKRMEMSLKESEELYRTLVETTNDLIFKVDLEGNFLFLNNTVRKLFGRSPESFIGSSLIDLLEESEVDRIQKDFGILSKGKHIDNAVYRIKIPSNTSEPFQISASPLLNSEGNVIAILGIARNISEQVAAKQLLEERAQNLEDLTTELESSLQEKEILLKEIHHRVKNNLQIISAITAFHAQTVKEEENKQTFQEYQQRIKALAKIHELLYRSDDLARVDLEDYLRGLIQNLKLSYNINPALIKVEIIVDQIKINLSKAMHIGLIVNELVSNAFKYAFPDNQKGKITIRFAKKDKEVHLQIEDTGIGMKKQMKLTRPKSMGLRIVATSTKQLKGTINLKVNGGTQWHLIFQEERLL